ncbi:hypothetical protein N0V86_008435 [Didymella sp. IMI 355093]|nr:hypothetical protein N0V86_008435 [Didymella sp. IMI 355093]
MSSNSSFAALYVTMSDDQFDNDVDGLDMPCDGTREGMVAALMQASADSYAEDPTSPAAALSTLAFDRSAAESNSATHEPTLNTGASRLTLAPTRILSWADEKEEEEQAATAEAETKAQAEMEAKEGWATVKKPKKRSQRKEQVVITEAEGSQDPQPTASTEPTMPTESTGYVQEEKTAASVIGAAEIETASEIQPPPMAIPEVDEVTSLVQEEPVLASETVIEEERVSSSKQSEPGSEAVTETVTEPVVEVKDVAAINAAPEAPVEAEKKTASRRRKNKRAAKKAQAAAEPSPPASEATVDASDDISADIEGLRAVQMPAEECASSPSTPPTDVDEAIKTPSAAPSYSGVVQSKSSTIPDSWDDYMEAMPTIKSMLPYQSHAARRREFEAEKKAQARFEADLPAHDPADDEPVTAAELRCRHEEAEMTRRSAAPTSSPLIESVVTAAQEANALRKSEVEVDEVETPAVPTSRPAIEPEMTSATKAEVFPTPVRETNVEVVRDPNQPSITAFFKKAPVVTIEEMSSTASFAPAASPAEPIEAIIVMAQEPVLASQNAEVLLNGPATVETGLETDEDTTTNGGGESEVPSQEVEVDVTDSINVANYLDWLPSDDDLEFEDAENLLDTSVEAVGSTKGAGVIQETGAVHYSAQELGAQEQVTDSRHDDGTTESTSDIGNQSPEPLITRQKKKRTKAERNAAKKRKATDKRAAAAVPATVTEVDETSTDATVPAPTSNRTVLKPLPPARANRREKRKNAKPVASATNATKDVTKITVKFAEAKSAKPEKQPSKVDEKKADSFIGTLFDKVTAVFKNADGKKKASAELSFEDTIAAYGIMVDQGKTQNTGQKGYKRTGADRRRMWKPIESAPPPVVETLEKRKTSFTGRTKARLASVATGPEMDRRKILWIGAGLCTLFLLALILSRLGKIFG